MSSRFSLCLKFPSVSVYEASSNDWRFSSLLEATYIEVIARQLNSVLTSGDWPSCAVSLFIVSGGDPFGFDVAQVDTATFKIMVVLSDESGSMLPSCPKGFHAVLKAFIGHENPAARIERLPLSSELTTRFMSNLSKATNTVFFAGNVNRKRTAFFKTATGLPFWLPNFVVYCLLRLGLFDILLNRIVKRCGHNFEYTTLFTRAFNTGLSRDQYVIQMRSHSLVWCPPGFISCMTIREAEAAAHGCIPVNEMGVPNFFCFWSKEGAHSNKFFEAICVVIELLSRQQIDLSFFRSGAFWDCHYSPGSVVRKIEKMLIDEG